MRAAPRDKPPRAWLQVAAFAAAALAVIATMPPRYPRNYPAWEIDAPRQRELAGLSAKIWVSRSVKTGLGLTLRLSNPTDRVREIAIESMDLVVAGRRFAAGGLPMSKEIGPHADVHVYLPILFDNEDLWNAGERAGELVLNFDADRATFRWELAVAHRLHGSHRTVEIECIPDPDIKKDDDAIQLNNDGQPVGCLPTDREPEP